MEMFNSDIIGIVASYRALLMKEAKMEKAPELPVAVSWARRLNMKELGKAAETINEALRDLDDQYNTDERSMDKEVALEDGKKTTVRIVKDEFMEEYSKKRLEILSQKTDVKIKMISIEALKDVALTEAQMDTLEFMIEEG